MADVLNLEPTPAPGERAAPLPAPASVEKITTSPTEEGKTSSDDSGTSEEQISRTDHTIELSSGPLAYTATAGYLPLKNESGDTQAKIFYIHYAAKNENKETETTRPLVFLFNGGPGSSSIWLHMGAFGPRRALLRDDGTLPPPPYELVDNEATLLREADLVFVDPVGTGFSRPTKPDQGKNYWGVQQDMNSLGEFIRLFLIKNGRMRSPLFLAGESYGTFRAAGLANHLLDKNIALNGVVLISTILDFRPAFPTRNNEIPYALQLPTLTAAAWHHKKLPEDLQSKPLREVLKIAEEWATTTYTLALMKGDLLKGAERDAVTSGLARLTSLSPQYLEDSNLRVDQWRFRKELLRQQKRNMSGYDARLLGIEPLAAGDAPDIDPLLHVLGAPLTMLFNDYVRNELGFKTDLEYVTLSGPAHGAWDYGNPHSSDFMDMSENLRRSMSRNTAMHALVASGIYDFVTPYLAARYTLEHLGLDQEIRDQISEELYEAGHMMYIEKESRRKLTDDVERFIRRATSKE